MIPVTGMMPSVILNVEADTQLRAKDLQKTIRRKDVVNATLTLLMFLCVSKAAELTIGIPVNAVNHRL